MNKENIKSTNWLTRGFTEEELAQKKKAAIEEAERELKERDIGTEIYELACILYENIEYNLGWHDCIYLADQAVKRGYRKQIEAEWIKHPLAKGVRYCSNCEENRDSKSGSFCPNCGAHMRNGE